MKGEREEVMGERAAAVASAAAELLGCEAVVIVAMGEGVAHVAIANDAEVDREKALEWAAGAIERTIGRAPEGEITYRAGDKN